VETDSVTKLDLIIAMGQLAAGGGPTAAGTAWIGGGSATVIREASQLFADDPSFEASFALMVGACGDDDQRSAALNTVANLLSRTRIFDAQFVPVLARHLAASNPGLRFRAAYLLGCLGAAASAHADHLAALIDDTAPPDRNGRGTVGDAALWALARQRDPRCVPELRRRLARERLGYGSVTAHYPRGMLFILPGIHEVIAAADAADELMDVVIDRLRLAHNDGDLELVNVLCHTLTANAEPAAPLLYEILRDSAERRVPEFAALKAIGRLGSAASSCAVELGRRAANGSAEAALALWNVTGEIEPTLTLLTAANAVLHLGAMGRAAAPSEDVIREHLASTHDWTRTHAAHALWQVSGDAIAAVGVLAEVARPLASGQYRPARAAALRSLLDVASPTQDVINTARAILSCSDRLSSSGVWRGFIEDEDVRDTAKGLADLAP
jgi:hypothetical protein